MEKYEKEKKDFFNLLIEKVMQLKTALRDNILAEQAAIDLYKSHVDFFKNELHLESQHWLIDRLMEYIENMELLQKDRLSNDIYKLLYQIILSGEEFKGIGSIKHILEEEEEHKKEFTIALEKLGNLEKLLKQHRDHYII